MSFFLIFVANLLCTLPGSAWPCILLCRAVSISNPKRYLLVTLGPQIIIWIVNHYVVPEPLTLLELLITFYLFFTAWYFAPENKKALSVMCVIIYMAAQFLATYFLLFAVQHISAVLNIPFALLSDTRTYYNAVMSLIAFCFTGPTMYLSHILICRQLPKLALSKNWLLFLPVPLSQLVLVNVIHRLIPYSSQAGSIKVVIVIGFLFCFLADICFFVGIRKNGQVLQLKAQIRMTEEQLNTQVAYYHQLQTNILAINQIRHDLSNQLQAAYHLLEQGEHSQVRSQLDMLKESIQDRVGPKFCANLMVDAVLTEKVKVCRENEIRLNIHVQIPSQISIENAHLCSIFSNLLDNSIQSLLCSGIPEKHISLESTLHAGCLIIRCSNPARTPIPGQKSKDPLRRHGLGLDILKRIVEEYAGSLETDYRDGNTEVTLLLPLSQQQE